MSDTKLDLAAIEEKTKGILACEGVVGDLVFGDIPVLIAELRACGKREHDLHGKLNSMQFQPMLVAKVDELEAELRAERARVAELEALVAELIIDDRELTEEEQAFAESIPDELIEKVLSKAGITPGELEK